MWEFRIKILNVYVKVGMKVHYIPFKGCNKSLYENGIVKSINSMMDNHVFVVFNCGDDWNRYQDYTGANTNVSQLREGWFYNA